MTTTFRVLLVEDNPGDAALTEEHLADVPGIAVQRVHTLASAVAVLGAATMDAIVLDLDLPDSEGADTLVATHAIARDAPIIVVCGPRRLHLRAALPGLGADEVFTRDEANSRLFSRSVLYLIQRQRARALHARVERLLDSTPDGVMVVSLAGVVRYVNHAALALFGRDRDDLVGELLGFSVRDGEPQELTIPRRDGIRTCELRVVAFEWQHEPAWLASIRDLTELAAQRAATERERGLALAREAALRRLLEGIRELAAGLGLDHVAQAAHVVETEGRPHVLDPDQLTGLLRPFDVAFRGYRDANRSLHAFSHTVAHDLRGPLNQVALDCERLARRGLGDGVVTSIRGAVRRMDTLIGDLLQLAVATDGALTVVSVDLADLGHDVMAGLRAAHVAREVEFVSPEHLIVNADPRLARSVLDNLLGNAFKFTGHRPHARIELGQVIIDGAAVVFVRDNGAGFDPARAAGIFDAFERLHPRDDYDGTGLGLNIVKRIVDRHGGRIWFDAAPGAGATFYFTFGAAKGRRA